MINTPITPSEPRGSRGISVFVMYLILLVGLSTEYFVLILILKELPIFGGSPVRSFCIYGSILLMLLHQFFIIRNFHIIDHLGKDDTLGNWIVNCTIEDGLRLILFCLFATLTGEIVYLKILWTKSMTLMDGGGQNGNTGEPILYNLTWITPFYLNSALIMSIVMVIWDFLGIINEKKTLPKIGWRRCQPTDKIVIFPLNSSFYTFLISDLLGLAFWWFLWEMVIYNNTNFADLFILFFILFLIIMGLRSFGELKVNVPKIIDAFRNYRKNTVWWRKKNMN